VTLARARVGAALPRAPCRAVRRQLLALTCAASALGAAVRCAPARGGSAEGTAAPSSADSASGPVTIRAGTLLDGRGGVLHGAVITVRRGRIEHVDTATADSTPVTYDLSARTVLPGLVDAHVHLGWYFTRRGILHTPADDDTPTESFRAIAANAAAMLMAGVTTVQSVGGPEDAPVRDSIARGVIPGPRVLTSLRPIVDAGLTPDELRQLVRQRRADGADLLKVFASTGIGGDIAEPMTDDQLGAICGEARALGLRTVIHAMSARSVRAATLAGCTQIEHGLHAGDAELRLMAERGVYFGPQVCLVFRNYLDRRPMFERSGFAAATFDALRHARPDARAEFARAIRTPGLAILFSTDAVAGAHGHNADELVCRVKKGGQRPMDAIVSATSVAARALGLGDRVGAIAPGLDADLIAVAGDPLRDIGAMRRVVFVMRAGRVYKQAGP